MIASLFLATTIIAHDPGYYTSLANHLKRWLGDEQIAAKVVTPKEMGASLAKENFAFLVGFESPTAAELSVLKSFRARGGKLVVFHSASPALAALMGVKCIGFKTSPYPGAFSRMDFTPNLLKGAPTAIRQTSTVLQCARPVPGKGRILAMWTDRTGKATEEPAWIETNAGFWMTHVLLADGDEDLKAQLVAALVGSSNPRAWSLAAHNVRTEARHQQRRAFALKQVPKQGEIHAVWDHSGCGLYPGNWGKTMHLLKEARVTDLFVNVAGAGFAHYPSVVLPRSKTFANDGDQLAKCLAAAKGTGIRVHAWMLAFSATRGTSATLEAFAAKGWRLKTASGKLTEYLDPANPAVRAYILSAIDEIRTKYPVDGIHLDFVRWGDGTMKNAKGAAAITQFVAEARHHVKRPKWLTTAVYGKYPACIASVGQDWEKWLDMNLVDYVVPMNYTDSNLVFAELAANQGSLSTRAKKTIAGLGVTANESRLDAYAVINQINLARKFGLAGVALFDLDITLEKQILPYLKLGIW